MDLLSGSPIKVASLVTVGRATDAGASYLLSGSLQKLDGKAALQGCGGGRIWRGLELRYLSFG